MSFYNFVVDAVEKVALTFTIVVLAGLSTGCGEKNDSSKQNAEKAQATAPKASDHPTGNSTSPMGSTVETKAGSMDAMIEQLRGKLKNNPDDVNGWVLLGKSYQFMQRWPEAEEAFSQAKKLGYEGEIRSTATGTVGGGASSTTNKTSQAVLDDIAKLTTKADKISNGISVNISLSSSLQKGVDPQTLVYIFARAVPQNTGQPAGPPLAVVKKKVADLPVTLKLDDSMAMMPQHSLSSVKEVMIVARISKSGSPIKQLGDIEKVVGPVDSSTSDVVDIVISAGEKFVP